jgi:hypothetical protein
MVTIVTMISQIIFILNELNRFVCFSKERLSHKLQLQVSYKTGCTLKNTGNKGNSNTLVFSFVLKRF